MKDKKIFYKIKKRFWWSRTVEHTVKVTVKKGTTLDKFDIQKIIFENMNQMKHREFGL